MTSTYSIDLLTLVDGAPRLIGARCPSCAKHVFPAQAACARCGATTESAVLPAEGTVWSWTVQRLAPKPPFTVDGEFEPFAVAYVDLGLLKVESRLAGRAPAEWRIGDRVRLAVAGDDRSPAYWFESASEFDEVSA